MQRRTKWMALALASVVVAGQLQSSWALKGFLKNTLDKSQPNTQVSQPATTGNDSAQPAAPVSNEPFEYQNTKYGYKVQLAGRWQKMSEDPKGGSVVFFDQNGNKGSFQVNSNWMADDFPVQSSLQAMAKSYEDRLKHKELVKYYRKDFTVKDAKGKDVALFQGYITIETGDDPDIRRMQWIGYGKGNYYNFTWASKPDQFDGYMPEFEKIVEKIQFTP